MCSSETSVDFQRTTQRHIAEDNNFHNHRCENFRSYVCDSCLVLDSECVLWTLSFVVWLRLCVQCFGDRLFSAPLGASKHNLIGGIHHYFGLVSYLGFSEM
jgi:hypothetical protein